ncbi:hypothetical protein AMTRI_Chr08g206320 [Amborella trichopoda]
MRLEIWFEGVRKNHMYSEFYTSSENKHLLFNIIRSFASQPRSIQSNQVVFAYYTVESHDYSPMALATVSHIQLNYYSPQIAFIFQLSHQRFVVIDRASFSFHWTTL